MRICSRTSTRKTLLLSARQPDELLQGETVLIGWVTCSKEFFLIINLVFNKMEETFQSNTLDWSSLVLSYFSLPPPASLDFSLISQSISMKFGMVIVRDETNRCLKFQVNRTRGRDRAWSQSLLCFIIGKTLYTVRRDKNFT